MLEVTQNANSIVLKEVIQPIELTLMPNPVVTELTILATAPISAIRLFSLEGTLLDVYPINALEFNLNVENLQQGIYFIVAEINGKHVSKKFVKSK